MTLCVLLALPAAAEKRVALVVGNGDYEHASRLANPANDAQDMAAALSGLGFDVISGTNLGRQAFEDKLRAFAQALAEADVALFFYAGHGLQAKGVNYLIPADATISNEHDLPYETITVDAILAQMQRAKTRIVILDACRNNPFARILARNMGSRAVDENLGLAITVASGLGTFISYATQPGNVASDGAGRNSPFTGPLKQHIADPGVSLADLMILVRHDVVAATEGQQVPWDHSALERKFYFAPGPTSELDPTLVQEGEAAQAWGWIRNATDAAIVGEFIRRYGDTSFGPTATRRLKELSPAQVAEQPRVIADLKVASLRPMQPSYDCKVHYNDAEVTICNNPELAMLDNELARLYAAASKGLEPAARQALLATQRQWLNARNGCSTDVPCIANHYHKRIKELGTSQPAAAAAAGTARPSFDCAKHFLPAEVAVCNDPTLARLDVELDKAYVRLARKLSTARRKALVRDQRQWLVERDTCGSGPECIKLQYEARLVQLQDWR